MFRAMIIVLCTSSAITLGVCGMDLEVVVALGALALGAFLGGIWHDPILPQPVARVATHKVAGPEATRVLPSPRRARLDCREDDETHELTVIDVGPPGAMPRFERTLGPGRGR